MPKIINRKQINQTLVDGGYICQYIPSNTTILYDKKGSMLGIVRKDTFAKMCYKECVLKREPYFTETKNDYCYTYYSNFCENTYKQCKRARKDANRALKKMSTNH